MYHLPLHNNLWHHNNNRRILNSHLFWLNSHPFFKHLIICRLKKVNQKRCELNFFLIMIIIIIYLHWNLSLNMSIHKYIKYNKIFIVHIIFNKGCVTLCVALLFTLKSILRQKKSNGNSNIFNMQKYTLQNKKILLKKPNIPQDIITL
jgi:hypothetical protein